MVISDPLWDRSIWNFIIILILLLKSINLWTWLADKIEITLFGWVLDTSYIYQDNDTVKVMMTKQVSDG